MGWWCERERERARRGFENSPSPDERPSLRHTQVSLNGNAVVRVTSRRSSIPSFELLMQTYGNKANDECSRQRVGLEIVNPAGSTGGISHFSTALYCNCNSNATNERVKLKATRSCFLFLALCWHHHQAAINLIRSYRTVLLSALTPQDEHLEVGTIVYISATAEPLAKRS